MCVCLCPGTFLVSLSRDYEIKQFYDPAVGPGVAVAAIVQEPCGATA